jgi:REP element-mobilizing transposase RayT
MHPIQFGGIEDHVRLLLSAPAVLAPAKIAQLIKGGSSGWIQETFPQLRGFGWQDGYGAFTVSKSNVSDVAENGKQGQFLDIERAKSISGQIGTSHRASGIVGLAT